MSDELKVCEEVVTSVPTEEETAALFTEATSLIGTMGATLSMIQIMMNDPHNPALYQLLEDGLTWVNKVRKVYGLEQIEFL